MQLSELFSPTLSFVQVEGRSKKRLFETVAKKISEHTPNLPSDLLFDALIARERLGSTGLGEGVAVPHCRLSEIDIEEIGVLVQLQAPIDFDAPDQKPVDLLAFLLVSGEANQEHLDALSSIAGILSDPERRSSMRASKTAQGLFDIVST